MRTVDVGDPEGVDGHVEAADARRPSRSEDRVRLFTLERGEARAGADLERVVELEADEEIRRRKDLALLEPGDHRVAEQNDVEPRVADDAIHRLVAEEEAVGRLHPDLLFER